MQKPINVLYRAVSAAFALVLAAGFAGAQTPPLRVMPLGDSITYGSGGTANLGGYRGTLYTSLAAAGYTVDYIGTQTGNSSGLADQDHEGHGGWRIDQLDANMTGWLASLADPDVVLMHIGTNDFGQDVDTPNAINRLDTLILKIATLRPYAHIIVTNLMERGEPANSKIVSEFNPYVQARVDAHAAAGRRVTFLDMRAAVPLADMPDNLHPNQTGYDKMAAAWLPAIQAVIGIDGDALPPGIYRAVGNPDLAHVAITFSKPIADASAVPENFTISGGLTVSAAALDATKRVVTLTTSPQAYSAAYTVTVNGVVDRTPGALALPANSTVNFFGATPRGYLNNVPEARDYTLVQTLDLPAIANYANSTVPYAVDNRSAIGPFNRIAYYVELQQGSGNLQYLWVSMDPFTTNVNQLGVPTLASGATFQQAVNNLNVVSNAPGVTTGTGLTGNLEFWPTNYNQTNGAGIPGASDATYDFGDTATPGTYGSMQIHNAAAGQTLFAFNNWGGTTTTTNTDLGIGNQPGGNPDWTFSNSAGNYTVRSLQVLVRTSGDTTPPVMTAAAATFSRSKVTITFSEPVAPASVNALNFSLDQGVTVLAATLARNQRELVLATTTQPAGIPLTLTASGVRDTSPAANRMTANSTIAVTPAALPPEIVANVGAAAAGYQLVYSLELPTTGNLNALGAAAYALDDSGATGLFSRVAYYLELQKTGQPVQYVWASMDAFTPARTKLGIPTQASGAVFQRNVSNLTVQSNVAGVVNGTTATGGNIEFWPNSYTAANGASVPNASATTYDTGDTRTTTSATGYGCMQVHNHDAGANQTVFAVNRFGVDGSVLDVGIGNNPSPTNNGVDWTFASNAPAYFRRILHVLVLPGPSTDPAVTAKVPEAADYQLVYSLNLPATGNLVSGTGFTNYALNFSADISAFSRVAYYMELQKTGDAAPRYVWTSMDAFTPSVSRIGIPTPASGAVFQQSVANLNVASNVAGVVTGTGITTGNIEFWPTNYSQPNAAAVPGASDAAYDFGDTRSTTGSHGTMQVHNHGAAQTLFALNGWGTAGNSGNALTMGIGNNPTAGAAPDYTLTATNGASWNLRRVLQVYVLPSTADVTGPVPIRAMASTTRDRLVLTFDEPIADTSVVPANFSIPGLSVTGATLLANPREVVLTTTAQTPGTVYTVTVSGIRDRTPLGNPSTPGASTTFSGFTLPSLISGIPEAAGYNLIYQLAIPSATPQWNSNPVPYSIEETKYGEQPFDRVAYLLELDSNWVFTSFDRHTNQLAKIGVPTLGVSTTPFQQLVTDMTVASNVAGIVTGTGIATGNIEFWGGNYSAPNGLAIPGASDAIFDFGDTLTSGGHGCLQVHNHGAGQVLLAYNNWGSNSGQISETGIGNHPTPSATNTGAQLDWTFSSSASASTVRNLYVLARPGGTPTGPAPVIHGHPCSQLINPATTTSFAVTASGVSSYQWRKNGTPIPGATLPWLDVTAADTGSYDVILTGPTLVTTTSLAATLSVNAAPSFPGYVLHTLKNTAAHVAGATIAARASDATAGPVSVTAAGPGSSSGGSVSFSAGTVHYVPRSGFAGVDTFPVTLTDTLGLGTAGLITVLVSETGQPPLSGTLTFQPNGSLAGLFIGTPGQTYHLQRGPDLIAWTTLQTLVAAPDGSIPFTDPAPPSGKSFYRIQAVP
jgi:lysophospholipase L1-like esterase